MIISIGTPLRATFALLGALGLGLVAASPSVAASGTPTTPTELFNGYQTCSTDTDAPTYLWGGGGIEIEGIPGVTDTSDDDPYLTARYRVWPVADPTQTTTLSHASVPPGFEGPVTVPASVLTDGQVYAWQAQTVATSAASDWSVPCYFAIDSTAPPTAPTVSSSNYPEGQLDQGGSPVHFTLDANGAGDVAGFEFSWQSDLSVIGTNIGPYGVPQPEDPYDDARFFARADQLGGSATLNLIPPPGLGQKTLYVVSLDRAFNRSTRSTYTFSLKSAAPTVTSLDDSPQFGKTTTFLLKPDAGLQSTSRVVSYSVEPLGGQSNQTVQVTAKADGTAKVKLKLDGVYGESLQVTSTSANGWVSDAAFWSGSYDTTPTVSSDIFVESGSSGAVGVPGTFSFAPKVKGVVSYTYSFNWGSSVTVKASNGRGAQISFTPSESGFYDLNVHATTKDGIELAPYDYYFSVN